jgi:hypothetical protein
MHFAETLLCSSKCRDSEMLGRCDTVCVVYVYIYCFELLRLIGCHTYDALLCRAVLILATLTLGVTLHQLLAARCDSLSGV